MTEAKSFMFFCPACDRPFVSLISKKEAEAATRVHVAQQHPDYDPFWFETYPDQLN